MKVISYGGGVQSTAMIVLAVTGRIPDVEAALFANVGDDSENPDTIRFVRDVVTPWAADRGLPVHELRRVPKRGRYAGRPVTLLEALTDPESRSVEIPVRAANGAPGNRTCTGQWKIEVIRRWVLANGATATDPAEILVGISTDEIERIDGRKVRPGERPTYPLLDLGLNRNRCAQVIRDAGLPVPPKSSCWFCPFHRPAAWAEMRRDDPAMFARAVDLENLLNERLAALGRPACYLTRFAAPLVDAIDEAQPALFDMVGGIGETGCDSGYCFT